jgi:hypothetical protein
LTSDPIALGVDDLGHLKDRKSVLVIAVDITNGDNAVTCGSGAIDLNQLKAQESDGKDREEASHI